MPKKFYPPSDAPRVSGRLPVGDGHELYYEEFGRPDGIPVVYLHGGPGAGHAAYFERFFDPKAFRVIVYDQRGAGKSTPFGRTEDNSPDHLVADLEKLRGHLGIDKWHVFGGSWGSTLALLYAETHPEPVRSLTLRGIFMMRRGELDMFYQRGDTNFPAEFAAFRDYIPQAERGDLITAYYNRIAAGDIEAAKVWTNYENSTCHLVPPSKASLKKSLSNMNFILGMAKMETHFFVNHPMTPDDRILRDVGKIRHIPTVIVQGHYDSVCPPLSAWELKQAFPEAHLQMIAKAGHSATEPGIRSALIECADRIRDFGTPLPRPRGGRALRPAP